MGPVLFILMAVGLSACSRCDIRSDLTSIDHYPYPLTPGKVFLHVANRSPEIRLVDLTITINDEWALTGYLDRLDFGAYKSYEYTLNPGNYVVRALFIHNGGKTSEIKVPVMSFDEIHIGIDFNFEFPDNPNDDIRWPTTDMRLLDGPPIPK